MVRAPVVADLCCGHGLTGLIRGLAADNLRTGTSVVADSCNPWELTRREWEEVAALEQAEFVNIEVVCGDATEHRRRVETRTVSIPGLQLPTWAQVQAREYHDWTVPRIKLDTAGCTPDESFTQLQSQLQARARSAHR